MENNLSLEGNNNGLTEILEKINSLNETEQVIFISDLLCNIDYGTKFKAILLSEYETYEDTLNLENNKELQRALDKTYDEYQNSYTIQSLLSNSVNRQYHINKHLVKEEESPEDLPF